MAKEMRLVNANDIPLGKFVNPDTEWKMGWNEALDAAASQEPTVAAVKVEQYNELKEENEVLRRRLQHLLQSETVRMYDEIDPRTREYMRDIRQLDASSVPATNWIPVTERLPENDVWVLVCKQDIKTGWMFMVVDRCTLTAGGDRLWLNDYATWEIVVTHWMPLPEPPKEV